MAETFLLEVVTPQSVVVSSQVEDVTAPGDIGEFGILPGHTFFVSLLSAGKLSYLVNGKREFLTIGKGFAEVNLDRVTVIVDFADYP